MDDIAYPSVNAEYFLKKILNSEKIDSDKYIVVGSTHSFLLKSKKAMHKRFFTVRVIENSINFSQSTGIALRLGFMGELLDWFEEHKDWKEGAYIVKKD